MLMLYNVVIESGWDGRLTEMTFCSYEDHSFCPVGSCVVHVDAVMFSLRASGSLIEIQRQTLKTCFP